MTRFIHHVALRDEWVAATKVGSYATSTRGRSLDDVGFVHCARADQVEGVVARFYADVVDDLVLLTIDTELLTVPVVDEPPAPGIDECFPHVYGPIPCSSVIDVAPLDLR